MVPRKSRYYLASKKTSSAANARECTLIKAWSCIRVHSRAFAAILSLQHLLDVIQKFRSHPILRVDDLLHHFAGRLDDVGIREQEGSITGADVAPRVAGGL